MPGVGLEPTYPLRAADFKSAAYTDSATRAGGATTIGSHFSTG